jgi:hypothetical protein
MKIKESDIKSIINMLESPDTDNRILGLSLINKLNFHTHRGELLLLKVFCGVPNDDWKDYAPEAHEYIKALTIRYNSEHHSHLNISLLHFRDISNILKTLKCKERVRKLHEYLLTKHIYKSLSKLVPISITDDIEITITIKIKSYE